MPSPATGALSVLAESPQATAQIGLSEQRAKEALVQGLSVQPRAGQPGDDGRLPVTEDPLGGGGVQPFGQSRQDHGDLVRRSFQTVQGSVTSSTERGAAGLTTKRLDALGMAMRAIANQ